MMRIVNHIENWEMGKIGKTFPERTDTPYKREITIKTKEGETIILTLHADDKGSLSPYDIELEEELDKYEKELEKDWEHIRSKR